MDQAIDRHESFVHAAEMLRVLMNAMTIQTRIFEGHLDLGGTSWLIGCSDGAQRS